MKNSEAAELFNILNSAKNITVGSDLETAVLKTLRKMNNWRNDYLGEINEIEDRNAATLINDGVPIRVTKVLSRTIFSQLFYNLTFRKIWLGKTGHNTDRTFYCTEFVTSLMWHLRGYFPDHAKISPYILHQKASLYYEVVYEGIA